MVAEKLVTLKNCTVLAISRNAVLVDHEDRRLWVPKAVIENPPVVWSTGSVVTFRVDADYARREGLE